MKKNIFIFIAYLIILIITTFPLLFKFTTYIPGFFSSDESYSVLWGSWFNKYAVNHKLSLTHTDFIVYPFGRILAGTVDYLWFVINFILGVFTNSILTYNIQVLINFLFNPMLVCLLVYYLSKDRLVGFLSGLIFGFCPYVFMRSWQHLGETYLWMIPMALLAFFMLRRSELLRVKLFAIFSLIVATINFNAVYYMLVIMSYFTVFLITELLAAKFKNNLLTEKIKVLKRVFIICFLSFLLMLPQFIPIAKKMIIAKKSFAPAHAHNLYKRPFEDLLAQSARPLSYLLPSAVHPLFGKFTEQFVGSSLYGISFTEHTLYLGWVPLTLAFLAVRRWKKKREDSYIGFFIFLAVVTWFFSQPPWWEIASVKIYMPSFFMYKTLPMFRAYCRFGIIVMLAVAVLAGFGLKSILERFKAKKTKIAVTALFCGLVLFEFWNWPPYKVIDVSQVPAAYYWLKEQPGDFVIAEYPLDIIGPNELYKLYQTHHEKKIINGTIPGTSPHNLAKTITKLSDPRTAEVLKWMGVKYVLAHTEDYLKSELVEDKEELDKIPYNSGLKLVKTFPAQECPRNDIMCIQKTGPIDVYDVVAE